MAAPRKSSRGRLGAWGSNVLLPALRCDLIGKLILGGAVGLLCMGMFQATQHLGFREPWMQLDSLSWHWLPFGDGWTGPYLSMMVLVGVAWVLLPSFGAAREFGRYFVALAAVGWMTFLVFPTGSARPIPTGMSWAYLDLIQIDPPTNGLPCLHCGVSIMAAAALTKRGRVFGSLIGRWIIWLWVGLISLSTLGLRQHSDLDVVFGVCLGVVVAALYVRTRPTPAPMTLPRSWLRKKNAARLQLSATGERR